MSGDIVSWLLAEYDAIEAEERRKWRPAPPQGKPCPDCAAAVDRLDWRNGRDHVWWEAQPCGDYLSTEEVFESMMVESAPDPAVLADLAVKRRIVEMHKPRGVQGGAPYRWTCTFCDDAPVPWEAYGSWPCQHVRLLALPLSHRPGYQQEWAVDL